MPRSPNRHHRLTMRNAVLCCSPAVHAELSQGLQDLQLRLRYSPSDDEALRWFRRSAPAFALLEVQGAKARLAATIARWREGNERSLLFLVLPSRWSDGVEAALRGGADDALATPVDTDELRGRCRALLRRHQLSHGRLLQVQDLVADEQAVLAMVGDRVLALSRNAFQVLVGLMRAVGCCCSREDLAPGSLRSNVVDQLISRLRRELRSAGSAVVIETVRGRGYRLVPPQEQLLI